MNSRQRAFVYEYLVDRNATAAAKRAGYSPNRAKQQGWRLMQNPAIQALIAEEDLQRQERLSIDADALVGRLLAIHYKAFYGSPKVNRYGEPIMLDGEQLYEWSPTGATKPIELLMRHLGIAGADKHQVTMDGEVVYTLTLDRELPSAVLGEDD